ELRLRRESEVRVARARGKAYADGPLVVRVKANPERTAHNRYAVVAGKRVGKAVERNRCKRLVREAIRRLHPQLKQGHDLVFIIRGGVEELTGLDVAEASLTRIAKRARLLDERSAKSESPASGIHANDEQ
ncbi:MAG TPA: ribonuclease P protein component, partial [Thermomicrobiales bacterium]|nr:ribonuclease P protein component [Thermomicrobiales bacterium]